MGLARAVDIRNSTVYLCKTRKKKNRKQKTVMKGDFDSPAKLEIVQITKTVHPQGVYAY